MSLELDPVCESIRERNRTEYSKYLGSLVGHRFLGKKMNATSAYDFEREHLLGLCLDRNICMWLASLPAAVHIPRIFDDKTVGNTSTPILDEWDETRIWL